MNIRILSCWLCGLAARAFHTRRQRGLCWQCIEVVRAAGRGVAILTVVAVMACGGEDGEDPGPTPYDMCMRFTRPCDEHAYRGGRAGFCEWWSAAPEFGETCDADIAAVCFDLSRSTPCEATLWPPVTCDEACIP